MTPEPVVVDASIVIATLIDPSEAADELVQRLKGTRLHAPDHLPVEVTNVLRRRRNAGSLTETEARLAIDGLWCLPLQYWPFEALASRAWQLGNNVSAYDAAYVALAESLDAPLLTADARLARAPGTTCAIELYRH